MIDVLRDMVANAERPVQNAAAFGGGEGGAIQGKVTALIADAGGDGRQAEQTAQALPTEAEVLEQERRTAIALDAALERETKDPDWAPAMESGVEDWFLLEETTGASLKSVECGQSLCRVEVAFDSVQSREAFEPAIAGTPAWTDRGTAMIRLDGWEDLDVEVYFARSGMSLAELTDGGAR
ncbi:MAG: hypothetical protein HY905_13695 [Deltaproteobacteria bacterium]|nr:hypothetical protein [Deltaproteobacteria bacterium]